MKVAQQRELITIESTQRQQYVEFTHAWDKYMSDYENTALELIDQLKEKQGKEMNFLLESIPQKFYKEYRWPKRVIEKQKLI